MSARARWLVIGIGVLLVFGLGALFWFNTNLTEATIKHGPHTWVVQTGETLTLSADEVDPGDEYICPGKGGVIGTPDPGRGVGGSGGLSVETAPDGTVTAYCEPGPPGNM